MRRFVEPGGRDVSRCDICVISDQHIISKNTYIGKLRVNYGH